MQTRIGEKTLETVFALFAVFSVILGVSSLMLYPAGLTYSTAPVINFTWLVFGLALVRFFTRDTVSSIQLSKKGAFAVILVFLASLFLAVPDGDPVARSIKLVEIIFQDLVIGGVLVALLPVIEKKRERIALALAFAAIHTPLFSIAPSVHALVVTGASFVVASFVPVWFKQTNRDMAAIIVPHVLFYLLFGNFLTGVSW